MLLPINHNSDTEHLKYVSNNYFRFDNLLQFREIAFSDVIWYSQDYIIF